MPRHRPVDYPQVYPPTTHPQFGLAPPQQPWAEQTRFSWQATPTQSISPSAERDFEAGLAAQKQNRREQLIPPLPVLPDHLDEHQQAQTGTSLPSQPSAQFQPSLQNRSLEPQHQIQFRSDAPRGLQQAPPQPQESTPQYLPQVQKPHFHRPSPTPTYEASQAAYHPQHNSQRNMQEQVGFVDQLNASQPQHPEPTYQSAPTPNPVQSGKGKATMPTLVQIEPDMNPLSPTSPLKSTNIRTFPPPSDMHFAQTGRLTEPRAERGGTWHHGLSSCVDPTVCLSSLFCPCAVYGRTQYRLSLKSAKKDPTNMLGYSAINGSCVAWSLLCGVNLLLTAVQHTRIRKAYHMESQAGNLAADCLKSICCCCCVLAQDEKEMKVREDHGRKPDTVTQGYMSPGQMMFASPPP